MPRLSKWPGKDIGCQGCINKTDATIAHLDECPKSGLVAIAEMIAPDVQFKEQPAQLSSESNEHYTPAEIGEKARSLMGTIHLDPASCLEANQTIQAGQIYTIQDDGLTKDWHGKTFLNPPGGALKVNGKGESVAGLWWWKLSEAWYSGVVEEAFFCGFTLEILRHSQKSRLPVHRFHRCYPQKRIHWSGANQPTHANVLIYLPKWGQPWLESFARFEQVMSQGEYAGLCEPGYWPLTGPGISG